MNQVRPLASNAPPDDKPYAPLNRIDALIFTITILGASLTRLIGLTWVVDEKNGPIFDEKHYVPQAWQTLTRSEGLGSFLTGTNADNPGYGLVVHPPLSKELIAAGMSMFGYNPLGWRISAAVVGIITVVLIVTIVRRLAMWVSDKPSLRYSTMAVAGLLALFDGVLLVVSRVGGMLDIFLTGFVVLATYFLVRDHEQMRRRWANYAAPETYARFWDSLGPRTGIRWWRLAAGLALGLGLGVKWSALYVMAVAGIVLVGANYLARRKAMTASGSRPLLGTLIYDSPASFAAIVLVPLGIFLYSWRGWFTSETSVYRHTDATDTFTGTSWFTYLPDSFVRWLDYQWSVLSFHSSLTTSAGHEHPWESKPWTWLWMGRPMMYQNNSWTGECGGDDCRQIVMLFGNPAIWWLTIPAFALALVMWAWKRQSAWAIPVLGFAATWVPWAIGYDRQMYFFYAAALSPFLIIALSLGAGYILSAKIREAIVAKVLVAAWIMAVVGMFVYFAPILFGVPVAADTFDSMMWMDGWKR